MSLVAQINEARESAKAAFEAARQIRADTEAHLPGNKAGNDPWEDSRIAEKQAEAERYFDEADQHRKRAEGLEREQKTDAFIRSYSHPMGDTKTQTRSWKSEAKTALERLDEGESKADLEEHEQRSLQRLQRHVLNKHLHINPRSGATDLNNLPASWSDLEKKAIGSLVDSQGGLAVREAMGDEIIGKIRDFNVLAARSRRIETDAASLTYRVFDITETLTRLGQKDTMTPKEVGDMLGKTQFTPHKFGDIYQVPIELIEDQSFDLVGLVTDEIAMEWSDQWETLLLTGSGVNEPLGLISSTILALMTEEQNGELNAVFTSGDRFIDMVYNVRRVLRNGASWIFPRQGLPVIRQIKMNGIYAWAPGMQPGEPGSLLGYPVDESEAFPDNWTSGSANDVLGLFGSLPMSHWSVFRSDLTIETLRELYAETDEVGFKYRVRADAAPVRLEGFNYLSRGAAA